MLRVNNLVGFGARRAAAGSAPAVSYLASDMTGSWGATQTFSSLSFGDAASDRYLVAAFFGVGTSTVNVTNVTIGGITATQVVYAQIISDIFRAWGFWIAAVPSGTSGDVVVTATGGRARCTMALYRLTGLSSATAVATGTDDTISGGVMATSLSVNSGDVLVGFACDNLPGTTNINWSGVTKDFFIGPVNNTSRSGGSVVATSTGVVSVEATFTGSTSGPTLVAAAWR